MLHLTMGRTTAVTILVKHIIIALLGITGIITTITIVIGIVGSTVALTRVTSHSRGGNFSGVLSKSLPAETALHAFAV